MYNLTAVLRLRDQSFTRGMRQASNSVRGLRTGAMDVVKTLGLITTAGAAVGVAMSSVNKAMDFESQMSTIKALTGATGAEMKQMQNLALDMGAKTKYSAIEAGQGIEELLKAGLTPATVQAGGLEAALNLATAGGLDLAESAEIMSTSLNSFSKDGMKAADAANILAGTANASATDVHDLKYSLSAVAAVASGAGLSLRDTSAALGVLANKGLKGSDAGTSLKSLLLQLQPTTKKTAKLFNVLGLETDKAGNAFYDAKGNIKSMADIAQVLQDKFKDMTSGERQAAFKEAFGTDAIRAANILYEAGAKGVKNFNDEMSKVTALDVAKEKMNNASGAVEQFKGAMETLQIAVLLPLMPVIKDAANAAADFVSNLDPETIQSWGDNIKTAFETALTWATNVYNFISQNWPLIRETIVGVTVAVAAFRLGMIGLAIVGFITNLINLYRNGMLAATIAQWAMNTAMLACPATWIVLAIAAVIAIGVLLYRNWDTVKQKAMELWAKLGPLQGVFRALVSPITLVIRAVKSLISHWGTLMSKISSFKMPSWVSTAAGKIGGALGVGKSHAGGLSNVPYNGYQATLHKGERVLTPEENESYNKGRGKGGGVTVNVATMNVRNDSDIKKVALELAKLIEKEGAWA